MPFYESTVIKKGGRQRERERETERERERERERVCVCFGVCVRVCTRVHFCVCARALYVTLYTSGAFVCGERERSVSERERQRKSETARERIARARYFSVFY